MTKKIVLILALSVLSAQSFAEKPKSKSTPPHAESKLKLELIKLNGSEGKDIVEIATGSKDHSTLVAALKAADLVDTLTGPGPYTIFAPVNSAFDKLPKGTVESLLKPENKLKLKSILEHHAAAPAYNPTILSEMTEVDMVDGPKLQVKVKDQKIFVDDVEIKTAISAKNGIVYIVDTVLTGK
ncbi:MAG TPA: fasciclin domain-containing protein [Pseudobdellovibrionaceae bacterium]|jgi:uncharacterized surface protein with fasciclin (FAS1) repeats